MACKDIAVTLNNSAQQRLAFSSIILRIIRMITWISSVFYMNIKKPQLQERLFHCVFLANWFFFPLNFWRCEMREKKWSGLGSVWSQELSLSFSFVANNWGLQGLAEELLLAEHSALAGFSSCLPAVDLGRSPEQWHPRGGGGGGGKGAQIIQSSMGISPRGEKKNPNIFSLGKYSKYS